MPDKAQQLVRVQALREGKLLYMAVPKLAGQQPFVLLDPRKLGVPVEHAAENKTALEVGEPISVEDMQPVDLVICGSVAVNRRGVRSARVPVTPTLRWRCWSRRACSASGQPL